MLCSHVSVHMALFFLQSFWPWPWHFACAHKHIHILNWCMPYNFTHSSSFYLLVAPDYFNVALSLQPSKCFGFFFSLLCLLSRSSSCFTSFFFLLEFFLYFFSSLLVCSAFPLVSCWWPLSSPLISHPLLSCSFSLVPCSAVFCFVTPWSLVRCFFIFCFSFFCSLTPFSFSLFSCSQFSGPFSLVIWCL